MVNLQVLHPLQILDLLLDTIYQQRLGVRYTALLHHLAVRGFVRLQSIMVIFTLVVHTHARL